MQVAELESNQATKDSRLQRLIRIYETGQNSELMDHVLDKVFAQEAADTQAAIARLDADIQNYENRYGMASDEFDSQFHAGKLGDQMDFIEWSSLILMRSHLQERLETLTGNL